MKTHLLLAAATLVAASPAFAAITTAPVVVAGTATDLSGTTSTTWVGGVAPTGTSIVDFTSSSATTLTVSSDVTWNQLWFGQNGSVTSPALPSTGISSPTADINISGSKITLLGSTDGPGGADANSLRSFSAKNVTIGNDIAFGNSDPAARVNIEVVGAGNLTLTGNISFATTGAGIANGISFRNGSSTTGIITITGAISSTGTSATGKLFLSEAGTVVLTGNNTFNGEVFVGGTTASLFAGSNTAFGTGTLNIGGSANTIGTNSGTARSLANNVTISNAAASTTTFGKVSVGTGALSFSGTVGLGGFARTLTTNVDTTFSNIVSNTAAAGIIKSGSAKLTLSGANTYTGGTTINAGTLITGNTSALGSGNGTVAVTGTGTTLQIGAGGVTLGSGALLTVASGSILKFTDATSLISLSNGYTLTGAAIIDLNGGFAGTLNQTYNLISGAGTKVDGSVTVQNGASGYGYTFSQGVLTVSAVPEPSTYGLIGAGALAAVALVRRRRKHAGNAA